MVISHYKSIVGKRSFPISFMMTMTAIIFICCLTNKSLIFPPSDWSFISSSSFLYVLVCFLINVILFICLKIIPEITLWSRSLGISKFVFFIMLSNKSLYFVILFHSHDIYLLMLSLIFCVDYFHSFIHFQDLFFF